MKPHEIEAIEVDLLLEALYRRYGYDFRAYARASIERRIRLFASTRGMEHVSELISQVIHDGELFYELLQTFSISVTEMFRDPTTFRAIREQVVPGLKSFPFIKVWHAGCATGEEAYSLAILLSEAGILERSTLYGTDFNDKSLERARAGIYPVDRIQAFTRNYQDTGGTSSFSEYYHASYDCASMNTGLRERILFANHNLITDAVFSEFHVVFCRNVLIYFNRDLQNKVLKLITDSLVRGGWLCLGSAEDLKFTDVADQYEIVDAGARIYRKKVQ